MADLNGTTGANAYLYGNWVVAELVNGVPSTVISFDTFISADVQKMSRVTEYPVEGSFMSYNKVRQSYVATITLGYSGVERMGGTTSTLTTLQRLDVLTGYVNTTTLLSITTPYAVFSPVTLEALSFDIKRENGGIVQARLRVREVRNVSNGVFKSVAAADLQNVVNNGLVQAEEPTAQGSGS